MRVFRNITVFVFSAFIMIIQGCGGGGSGSTGQAQSTTVALQAQVTPTTPMGVFAQYTSAANVASWGPNMDFTLSSK